MFQVLERELTLLYIARQGYWSDSKISESNRVWTYIYPMLLSSTAIWLIFLSQKELILSLLNKRGQLIPLSYQTMLLGLVLLALTVGIAYENYFVALNKTKESLLLFFNLTARRFQGLLFLKNLLLALPFLILGSYFYPRLFLKIFLVSHFLSFPFCRWLTGIRGKRKPTVSFFNYLNSLVDLVSLLRLLIRPAVQLSIFIVVYQVYPAYFLIPLPQPWVMAIFVGVLAYQANGLAYYALALNRDLPYLSAIGLNVEKWLRHFIFQTMMLPFVMSLFPIMFLSFLEGWSMRQLFLVIALLACAYLAQQGCQLLDSLYFKGKDLATVREVEAYRLSFKERLVKLPNKGLLLFFYPLAYVFRHHLEAYSLVFGLLLLLVFSVQFRRAIKAWSIY